MSEISRKIGKNIRALRKTSGLSQEQLALRADINASYMGQVERGEKNPTIDVLSKISSALGMPLEQIIRIDTQPKLQDKDNPISDKIAHQLNGLSLKEQEAVYRLVKQLVHFKDLD